MSTRYIFPQQSSDRLLHHRARHCQIEVLFRHHHIDWQDVDKQIKEWFDLATKRQPELRVNITFRLTEFIPQEPNNTTRIGDIAIDRQFARHTRFEYNTNTVEEYATWEKVGQIRGCPQDYK